MQTRNLPTTALTACVLGLSLCPLLFVACGALSGFSLAFAYVTLPPLALSTGFLVRRFASKEAVRATPSVVPWVLEGVSWVVVVTFLVLVSKVSLMTGRERLGIVAMSFLVASAGSLPVVLARRTALERRLLCLPRWVAVVTLLLVVGAAGWATMWYLATPPTFVG